MQDAAFDLHGPEQQGLAGVACRHVSLLDGHPDIIVLGGGVVDPLDHWRVVSCRAAAPALLVGAVGRVDVEAGNGIDPASHCGLGHHFER